MIDSKALIFIPIVKSSIAVISKFADLYMLQNGAFFGRNCLLSMQFSAFFYLDMTNFVGQHGVSYLCHKRPKMLKTRNGKLVGLKPFWGSVYSMSGEDELTWGGFGTNHISLNKILYTVYIISTAGALVVITV